MKTLVSGLAFLGLLLSAGCGSKAPAGPPASEAVPVRVARVLAADVPVTLAAVGAVEARSTVAVKSMVSGEIVRAHVAEGQEVAAGQVLFTIDQRVYEAAVRQAEAALARDLAQRDNARAEEKRYAELARKEYVTQEQYEKLRTAAETGDALVQADQAALDHARVQLGFCAIAAPVGGRLGELLIHPGNVVKANDLPLVTIHQIRPVNIAFRVPENRLAEIRRLQAEKPLEVAALPRGAAGPPVAATLDFIDNAVEPGTGTILLKATYPNRDAVLWPGQFVDVRLVLATLPQAAVVPSAAVQTGQQGTYLYMVKADGTAELRPVELGPADAGRTVIAKGVAAGETVVTDGHLRLVPGVPVAAKEAGNSPQ